MVHDTELQQMKTYKSKHDNALCRWDSILNSLVIFILNKTIYVYMFAMQNLGHRYHSCPKEMEWEPEKTMLVQEGESLAM